MEWRELIVDGYDRLPELTAEVLAGVRAADLDWPPRPGCNPLGWTVWHLIRVQDAQIADLMGEADLWTRDGWHQKYGRPPDHEDSGYGHTAAQVRAFRSPSAKVPLDYLRAVTERTKQYLASLSPAELDRELDEPGPDPPTVGVRLVSILADCHQHAGEASYIRGLLKARGRPSGSAIRKPRSRPSARKAARTKRSR
ncbi:MAG TPA: DinB family protein [Methylomirabilota bacterium]|nr:DinB family protein [Methylomirabilota bacterium]